MADLSHIFESLKELSAEDGTVGVERLKHVLMKIGMQDADAKSVMNVLQTSEGRVNLNDFAAWVSLKPQMSVAWNDNIILATDSYKFSHWKQYPPGTEYVYSYFESRGCERKEWNEVAFFGLQYFLKRYLLGQVITQAKIDEAVTMCSEHFIGDGLFYKEGFQYILEKHGGKLPISIKVWYPMTVCTNSRYQKLSIHKALAETGNEDWGIPGGSCFKLHDFGFRGVSSVESAALGGAAHLVNFLGTDTVAALLCCRRYYHATKAAGHSIPASEFWGDELKELIKGRISGDSWGRLVVRPDSGDPTETCVQIVTILCQQFQEDVITTKTGHKLLPPYIRVIQGDGVDYESVPKILGALKDAGFAADNMVFGSGGALLQKLNRDTFKCAFKCSEITVNGQAREVFKDPITDKGKASKKGRMTVQRAEETQGREEDRYKPRQDENGIAGGEGFLHYSADGKFVTVASGQGDPSKDLLVEVFRDGVLLKDWTLQEIRARADIANGPFSQG